MNRRDLRRLARIRLREARVLLEAGCFDGAYYLCGYAIECALKACIAKETKRSEFPELDRVKGSYTHNFAVLVKFAGVGDSLRHEETIDPDFRLNWQLTKDWSENARYFEQTEEDARNLHRAITDRRHGVMRWLRRHW